MDSKKSKKNQQFAKVILTYLLSSPYYCGTIIIAWFETAIKVGGAETTKMNSKKPHFTFI